MELTEALTATFKKGDEVLQKQIDKDLLQARKNRNKVEANILEVLKSEIEKKSKDLKRDLTEEEIIKIIQKLIKNNRKTIKLISNSVDRQIQAQDLLKENKTLEKYLPKMLNETELKIEIEKILSSFDVKPNIGLAMKTVMPKLKGKADGKIISKIVKELLK